MLGVTLVYMLTALNGSAISTALPRMAAELNGFELYAWPAAAYLLASIVAIPIVGWLGDLHGRKHLLLWAVALFASASVACAAVQTMAQLVGARAIQGIGGGMIAGVLSACIADLFPEPVDRMRWQLMHSVGFAVAQGIGPWLGGWLTEHASWRWVFLATTPVAAVAWGVTWRYFPGVAHHEGSDRRVDGPSISLPAEVKASRGTLQLLVLGLLTGLVLDVLLFSTPLLLQAGLQQSADEAGAVMTPLLFCITVASVANARIAMRMDRAEGLMVAGSLLLAAGCLLLAFGSAGQSTACIAFCLGLCGAGFGFLFPNITQHLLVLVSRQNGGLASALGQASRLLGGLLGAVLGWALVAFLFRSSMADALTASGWDREALADLVRTPQVLLHPSELLKLKQAAVLAGADPDEVIAMTKTALAGAVRASFAACAFLALVCAAVSMRLPPFLVNGRVGQTCHHAGSSARTSGRR